MLKLLLLLAGMEASPAKEYTGVQRFNDSLLIYNSYQAQFKLLTQLKEADLNQWYAYESYVDSLTACAKLRLKRYNKASYEPVSMYERPGMGIAFQYPCPLAIKREAPQPPQVKKETEPNNRYMVYDKQTHFVTDKNGKAIPYIQRLVYDKGRLMEIDSLNPVTYEKLEATIE